MARSANLRLLEKTYHRLKRADRARAAIDRAIALNRHLVAVDPGNPQMLRKLINGLRYGAIVHRTNMRHALAPAAITEAAALAAQVSARDPDDARQLNQLGAVHEVQAQVLTDMRDFARSFAFGDQAIAAHRRIVALAGNAPGAQRSLASALRTDGGNHDDGKDYAGACRNWRQSRDLMAALDREGARSDDIRTRSYAEMKDYVVRACDGEPRASLGPLV